MKTKTVFIAEDEPLARETLRDWIQAHPQLRLVGEAADGASALKQIDKLTPDAVFMDIQMPEMTGLQVLQRLTHAPDFIFTTAYDQYAVIAFELNAIDYLLKPFSRERFDAAVERLLEVSVPSKDLLQLALKQASEQETAMLKRILVRDRGHIFPLATDEIEYLKSEEKYTVIAARKKNFLVRIGLSELSARLDPGKFIRIHRSTLINLDFVESMKADDQSQLQIQMRDGTQLVANREASKMLRNMSI
ncbi:LytR/AlgR family response regulator transcription factor [Collimonas pratensis]|uniref:Response regulator n=1 Tax=Collimonas pratensis TaxID=279113 RepID=A0A127Q2Q7_9BURK|nr:LytTR family DNA-binding domain-containing protein [Collimonas pratensis]AMP04313.1 response regulator [Collimonas pratensis]AMP15697.1 response regulator [Collimonas pratensis]NKI70029.1 response regulator [Collimonas pratensis]